MAFREMRRFKQALSDEEITFILENEKRCVLAVNGDDGYPYAIPLDYVYEEGKIYFHMSLVGHKIDAINNDPKACLTIMDQGYREEGDWAYYVKSVVAFGHLAIIEDEDKKRSKLYALGKKYFPDYVDTDDEVRRGFARVHMVEMTIDHITGKLVHEK